MKEPVDHIERPTLPWRTQKERVLTECGYFADKVNTITRDQFKARLLEYGIRRTAILTCSTCSDTASRWGTWEESPRQAMSREIHFEGRTGGSLLEAELRAIAILIAKYPEEFLVLTKDAELWNEFRAANKEPSR